MRPSTRLLILIGWGILLPVLGCQSPKIRERWARPRVVPIHVAADRSAGAGRAPSRDELAAIRLRDEVEGTAAAPAGQVVALGELALAAGCRLEAREPAAALASYRDAAAYAWFGLARAAEGPTGAADRARAIALHNAAVERLLRGIGTGPNDINPAWREQLAALGAELTATPADRASLPCDELWIAADFRVRNLDPVAWDGLGVRLVAVSHFPDRQRNPDHYLPERMRLPATAVFRPTGRLEGGDWRGRTASLALHDPAREACVATTWRADGVPLAADLTTPLAHQFIESPLTQLAWGGLLRPQSYAGVAGVYMSSPYQPGKIPVLFVHGLWSSPDAWLKMTNWLQADPAIRARYQFWYAYYPTGAPLMISAVRVRDSLRGLRDAIDPGRSDPALDRMVVVGHSLGGVLTKQLLQTSGQALEQGLFTRPFDQVAMAPETRKALAHYLYFERERSVSRVIFIAAPHRGSNTANRLIGRLGTSLVRRPDEITALHAEIIARNGADVFQPFFRAKPPSSIDNLEWESPILKALEGLPIPADVPYHSVVANLVPDLAPRFWTDGVVSYESAHLDGAASEVMIRHNHFANATPEATEEVLRILKLHLESPAEPAATPQVVPLAPLP